MKTHQSGAGEFSFIPQRVFVLPSGACAVVVSAFMQHLLQGMSVCLAFCVQTYMLVADCMLLQHFQVPAQPPQAGHPGHVPP